ncbi:MAG: hypothetical protein ABI629_10950 [bacterium]
MNWRRILRGAARAVLVVGIVSLIEPPSGRSAARLSWENLLAPYADGTPIQDGFRQESGFSFLAGAQLGIFSRDLLTDRRWISPLLLPLMLLAGLGVQRRQQRPPLGALLAAAILGSLPFFVVATCSSDAVRYQGALLGLFISLAVVGLWAIPLPARFGRGAPAALRLAALAALVLLPSTLPLDPAVVEHRLVEDAVTRIAPGTLIVLPRDPHQPAHVNFDFPDFLLPAQALVVFDGDPALQAHDGPRLYYLGLACLSGEQGDGADAAAAMRPECRALRDASQPWAVTTLHPQDIPHLPYSATPWTFFHLTTDVPFGFFAPDGGGAPH